MAFRMRPHLSRREARRAEPAERLLAQAERRLLEFAGCRAALQLQRSRAGLGQLLEAPASGGR
eukprot:4051653-Lingulodinium_polyedra.AAC.1